jgi:hypothetical protein
MFHKIYYDQQGAKVITQASQPLLVKPGIIEFYLGAYIRRAKRV